MKHLMTYARDAFEGQPFSCPPEGCESSACA
jgi:hypothetical protein